MSQFARFKHLLEVALRVYLRPYWRLQVVFALAIAALVVLDVSFPLAVKYLIDAALIPHDFGNFVTALVVLVLLFALTTCARYVAAIIKVYMGDTLAEDICVRLIRLIGRLPMDYFDRARPGHFAPLFDTEMLAFGRTLRDLVPNGFHAVLQFAVIMTTLFILNWALALAVLAMLPLLVLLPQRRFQPSIAATDKFRRGIEGIISGVQDHIASQTLVHAFGRKEVAAQRFIEDFLIGTGPRNALRRFSDVQRIMRSTAWIGSSFKLSIDNQQAALTLLVIGAGACLSYAGMLSLGTFSAFMLFLPGVMRAIKTLADYAQDMSRGTLSLDRFEALGHAATPEDRAGALLALPAPAQSIRFDQVAFSYSPDKPYIQNLNLTLPIGQSLALVGRSGSGKSTLFRLLLGFYGPTAGRVLIDNQDLRAVDPASLGAHIGSVLQQSVMLNTTIRKNICFAKPEATDDEIIQAARLAEIHDYIVTLPKGYESGVGDGGKWLSEGQKQRIALARAILPNPAILLLDEVTSALDPESEAAVNATIQRLAKQRTVILVTHRLASVKFVDVLAVMDQGQLKEQGSHEALLAQQGIYHRLWQMQSGFVVSGDGHHAEVGGERLQAIPLFRDVALDILNQLAGKFVSGFYQKDRSIYEEGQPGDRFFIIVRGTVSVSSLDAAGNPIRLADMQDGDYFGEGEMLNRGRRATSVTATSPSLVLALRAEHFHAMMNELSSLNKIVTQMALGRSLSTICSVGRRRRSQSILHELGQHAWKPLPSTLSGI